MRETDSIPVKVFFNVFGMMANASALCYVSYHWLDARKYGSNKPILLMVAALVFFLANTLPISDRHRADRRQIEPQGLVGVLLLVVPLLSGGRRGGGAGGRHQPARRLADIAARSARDLLGVPLLSTVSGTAGSRERAGGD